MRSAASVVVLLVTLAAAAVAAAAPQYVPSIVTLDGVGEVRPGQSVAQVERSFGVDLRPETIRPGCAEASFGTGGARGQAIFVRGRLGSLWFDRGVLAGRGVGIGSTFAAVRRAYRRIEIRTDAYIPEGRNVFVRRSRAPHWHLRFDVSPEGRVSRISFGDRTVYFTEGCA